MGLLEAIRDSARRELRDVEEGTASWLALEGVIGFVCLYRFLRFSEADARKELVKDLYDLSIPGNEKLLADPDARKVIDRYAEMARLGRATSSV